MTKDEALKLALEALELEDMACRYEKDLTPEHIAKAITAIREALAEQETVLPGGGHVPAVPVAVYGYCPECGGAGVMRERRPNGDDKCTNGHKYPSSKALAEQPAQPEQCECPACKVTPHASDCAVHNEPAYPKGACNCGAKPEQEPDGYVQKVIDALYENSDPVSVEAAELLEHMAQPQQEPVACIQDLDEVKRKHLVYEKGMDWKDPLYTTPPQRKPLLASDIVTMYDENPRSDSEMIAFARAIEAAHGIFEEKK